jgi:hypothetical protein
MKKIEKEFEKWGMKMYEKYKSVLFIEKFNITVEKDKKDRYMASEFNYPYLDATIYYSDKALKDWVKDKKDSERRIIHEFCHIITDPFYAVVTNWPNKVQLEEARERMTDHIAQIVNKHFNLIK